MSAKTMSAYLSTVAASYATAMNVTPQKVITEVGEKNQVVHVFDDDSETVVDLNNAFKFELSLQWVRISEADSGTIIDYYYNSIKANGLARSFVFTHPDGNNYTVKFRDAMSRNIKNPTSTNHNIKKIKLKVLGNHA